MTRIIPAIETVFSGCRFRSRLEARWAVVFNELGIRWQYEPDGFEIFPFACKRRGKTAATVVSEIFQGKPVEDCPKGCPHGTRYLPDFYLPDTETWVEVKGSADALPIQTLSEAIGGEQLPNIHELPGDGNGLLLLGPLPIPTTWPLHPLIRRGPYGEHEDGYAIPCTLNHTGPDIVILSEDDICASFGYRIPSYPQGYASYIRRFWSEFPLKITGDCPPKIAAAYEAGRHARFEHGERG